MAGSVREARNDLESTGRSGVARQARSVKGLLGAMRRDLDCNGPNKARQDGHGWE